MEPTLLKAGLHRACATRAEADCEGPRAIGAGLPAAGGILPHERIDIHNVTDSERLSACIMPGEAA